MKFVFFLIVTMLMSCSEKSNLKGGHKVGSFADRKDSSAFGDGSGGTQEQFKFGPRFSERDILIIFDNSVSMTKYIDQVRTAFDSLVSSQWNDKSKIAVMTTMPGNPGNLNQVHSDVDRYNGIDLEPGFLSLVSAAGLQRFLSSAADYTSSYPDPICESEWFSPNEKNSKGKSCLSAALQSPFHGVGCEAGLTALNQILDKKKQLFRSGSVAQVLFVSDIHDPGCSSTALKNIRPTSDHLVRKISENSRVSAVKFHGIVPLPGTETAETIKHIAEVGFSYSDAVKATGGILLDIAADRNYSVFAGQVAAAALSAPQFVLQSKVSKIIAIKVNGKSIDISQVKLLDDEKTLEIANLDLNQDSEIVISYVPSK